MDEATDDLKPLGCPHCPESMVQALEEDWPSDGWWRVWCGACGSSSGRHRSESDAITAWNRRA
jgi:hypothetical protein